MKLLGVGYLSSCKPLELTCSPFSALKAPVLVSKCVSLQKALQQLIQKLYLTVLQNEERAKKIMEALMWSSLIGSEGILFQIMTVNLF